MSEVLKLSVIALGAVIGALGRYYAVIVTEHFNSSSLPLGVLFVNWTGSFCITLIAWVLGHKAHWPAWLMPFFVVGMLGSFTTFSTFSMDNLKLIQQNQRLLAVIYSMLSVIGGLICAWAGYFLAHVIIDK